MNLLIKGGTVVNPAKKQHEVADVLVKDGKIAAIGQNLSADGADVYDATGLVVAPGLIDMHTHLREPGQEAKEDFYSGTQAAAAGGFTRVATMANTTPVVDNAALVRGLRKQAELTGVVKVEFMGAVSKGLKGKELAEMGDMAEAGVVGFSDDGHYVESAAFMRRALEYSSMFNKPVIDHAEEVTLTCEGHMHEGFVAYEMGVKGRPAVAEDMAVARDLLLAEMTGGHIHIAHVSSKDTVDQIRRAKAKGIKVTCEVTAQHLAFTDEYLREYNPAFKMAPPIRSEEHRQALLAGVKDGTIDAIITDHAPHAEEEKDQEFCCAPNGFSGLETSLAAVLTHTYKTGILTLDEIVSLMSTRPAQLLGVEGGVLEVGKAADITVFSTDEAWTVDRNRFYTKGKTSPFDGMTLTGRAKLTVVDGDVVMKEGVVTR
ncbi:dihydroorotase [Veillonella magna]|uniref:Dihydroorotase n=1 Tax=Veillonella magna TaxID=464322 RepID=A0ABS2GKA5_9FIRM|nr:dihydroorotase [Veillonella magna]MBM6825391.1 dihydroorotase [Veillonella magna]MBM6913693.1 dihydroorotase [Veillonella magna]